MRSRFSKIQKFWPALVLVVSPLIGGCTHGLGLEMESARIATDLGFAGCDVSEPLRRYQALDVADRIGNSNLADSPEWSKAISIMQPGDDLRRVFCRSNGNNFFGVFRNNKLLFEFGGMIYN